MKKRDLILVTGATGYMGDGWYRASWRLGTDCAALPAIQPDCRDVPGWSAWIERQARRTNPSKKVLKR